MNAALLRDTYFFVAIARARNFQRAAAAVGVSIATISRRLAALEEELGIRLLDRNTREVALTEAGTLYFKDAENIISEMDDIRHRFSCLVSQPIGRLRISAPEIFIENHLLDWVTEFSNQHPLVQFDLHTAPEYIDPVIDGFDICIRLADIEDSGLFIRRLLTVQRWLYAAPGYIEERGKPSHPSELNNHSCIWLLERSGRPVWTLTNGDQKVSVPVHGRLAISSPKLAVNMALRSFGIVPLAPFVWCREIAAGNLVPILPEWQCEPLSLSVLTATKLLPAKSRFFLDFLASKVPDIETTMLANCSRVKSTKL